jgi:hypothetical protein
MRIKLSEFLETLEEERDILKEKLAAVEALIAAYSPTTGGRANSTVSTEVKPRNVSKKKPHSITGDPTSAEKAYYSDLGKKSVEARRKAFATIPLPPLNKGKSYAEYNPHNHAEEELDSGFPTADFRTNVAALKADGLTSVEVAKRLNTTLKKVNHVWADTPSVLLNPSQETIDSL